MRETTVIARPDPGWPRRRHYQRSHHKCEPGGWRNRCVADKVSERDASRSKLFKIVSMSFEDKITARKQGFRDCMFGETERAELYQQKLRSTQMCDQLPTGKRAGIVQSPFGLGL